MPIEDAPRFTTISGVPQSLLPSAPAGGFPAIPASSGNGSFAISWGLDSAIKTPYSHLVDFSIARELRNGASVEVSYVGRYAHRQLAQEDTRHAYQSECGRHSLFRPCIAVGKDGASERTGSAVGQVPYWEQVFGALDGQDIGLGYGPLSATQNVYALFLSNLYNETYALYQLDTPGSLPNSNIGAGVNYPLSGIITTNIPLSMRGGRLDTPTSTHSKPCIGNASGPACRRISTTPFRNLSISRRRRSGWGTRARPIMRKS